MKELERRVLSAYFRSGGTQQPDNGVEEITLKGMIYFVLRNCNGILAVFRYIEQRDVLKRIKRLPKELK